jgi:hypothetical protein
VLLELRVAEAGADGAQGVGVEGEEGAALAEARVEAHAEREEHVFELPVREGSEAVVVEECEVLDEEGAEEAGAQGVDAEGHGVGEDVPDLLLHDAGDRLGAAAVDAPGRPPSSAPGRPPSSVPGRPPSSAPGRPPSSALRTSS